MPSLLLINTLVLCLTGIVTFFSTAVVLTPSYFSLVKIEAIFFCAREISQQTNYQGKAMSYYRTPEHRALRATLIKKWKPWEQSTGPKTQEGKAHASRNALKHGYRSQAFANELTAIKKILCEFNKVNNQS